MIIRTTGLLFLLLASVACTEQIPAVLGEPMPIVVPSSGNALGPRLTQNANGTTLLSWMERDKVGATLRFSRLQLGKWQPAATVITDPEMFVNWADLPAVTPTSKDRLFAHWLSYSADAAYAYDVKAMQSSDGGTSWGEIFSPHSDGTPSEHGFASIYVSEPGSVGMIWLDGRKTVNTPGDDPASTGMTLRGATIGPRNGIANKTVLDELICDCCQTDVAMTQKGAVAVYRNRSREEIRDIYVARQIDGQWQAGVAVSNDHWKIAGCPVNGPAIDANGKQVVIAWFSAANDQPVVRTLVSTDNGASFSEAVEIASHQTQGRVGIALIDPNSYAVSWLEKDEDGSFAINVRTLTMQGGVGNVKTIGRTYAARIVPQMVRVDDQLILAWADQIGDSNKIRSVRLPILGFYDN
jgi:hypothetical protein